VVGERADGRPIRLWPSLSARKVSAAQELDLRTAQSNKETAAAVNISHDGAVLVRPDGFIAWRTHRKAEPAVLRAVQASRHVARSQAAFGSPGRADRGLMRASVLDATCQTMSWVARGRGRRRTLSA
jgi:hypothetical protein